MEKTIEQIEKEIKLLELEIKLIEMKDDLRRKEIQNLLKSIIELNKIRKEMWLNSLLF
jgi:hypothetical protein